MIRLRSRRPTFSRVMTQVEEEHIAKVGRDRFRAAYDWAQFETRKDSHFVGLDKIRAAIAYEAALRATGFTERPLKFPRGVGPADQQGQEVAEQILVRATEVARQHVAVLV